MSGEGDRTGRLLAKLVLPLVLLRQAAQANEPGCVCTNQCIGREDYAEDGICDDGGEGSQYSSCELGTDCEDCSNQPRCGLLPPPSAPPSQSPHVNARPSTAIASVEYVEQFTCRQRRGVNGGELCACQEGGAADLSDRG